MTLQAFWSNGEIPLKPLHIVNESNSYLSEIGPTVILFNGCVICMRFTVSLHFCETSED